MKAKDFEHLRTHTFCGRRYVLRWHAPRRGLPANETYVGACDRPRSLDPEMAICPRQSPEEILSTVMHESAHACFPTTSEEAIEEFELDTLRLLKRMGLKVEFTGAK